jgi:hypothetical protein
MDESRGTIIPASYQISPSRTETNGPTPKLQCLQKAEQSSKETFPFVSVYYVQEWRTVPSTNINLGKLHNSAVWSHKRNVTISVTTVSSMVAFLSEHTVQKMNATWGGWQSGGTRDWQHWLTYFRKFGMNSMPLAVNTSLTQTWRLG